MDRRIGVHSTHPMEFVSNMKHTELVDNVHSKHHNLSMTDAFLLDLCFGVSTFVSSTKPLTEIAPITFQIFDSWWTNNHTDH